MSRPVKVLHRILLSLIVLPCASFALQAAPLLIEAQRMLDLRSGEWVSPARVLVEDGMIAAVNPEAWPEGTRVMDLGERSLLPGLMDMHTHLTLDFFTGADWVTMPVRETAADWAIRGVAFAKQTLMAGFTTVRDVGANAGFPDVALMRAIERGTVPGPRIWPAGHYISITGGHCDVTGFAPGVLEFGPRQGIANGVDEILKAVRYQAKHGVKLIKVCATAGVFSFSNQAPIGALQYSFEELRAIVEEAARHGLKVAAHAHGTKGINTAVRAGVASIEHGSMLSEDSIQLMREHGTYLVPNLYINGLELPPDTPQEVVAKNEFLKPLVVQSLEMAYQGGVKMALGTDACIFPHGQNGREFTALVNNGIPPLHALRMATVFAADLLGVDDRGEIAAGKLADLVAVDGNPLEDIQVMENVSFVMKGGEIYKQ